MSSRLATLLASLLLASAVAPVAARAENPAAVAPTPLRAETRHVGRFNGQEVRYRAVVAETLLQDQSGAPAAVVVTTAYLREDAEPAAARPVMFIFNGGPGASTTPLHFGAFGPMRRLGQGAGQVMVANPDSPLDAVDLVFIDPVGTGYSRPLAGHDGQAFWSRSGDAASVSQVIADWLTTHGREASPRYLLGQSYGTTRAALVVRQGQVKFDGVLLFALVGNVDGLEMPYVTSLPSFATVAWWHEKIDRAGRSAEQVYAEAVAFARTDYVQALIRGASLPAAEREALAQRMSALIGLPAQLILAKDLRLSNDDFMFNLLADQGLRTGQLDGRATARLDAPPQRPPMDDPGLNFSLEPAPAASAAPPAVSGIAAQSREPAALEAYFRDTLGFDAPVTYNSLNLDVNAAWDHEGFADANRFLGEAMQADPGLRLFWASGLFDLTTPAYRGRYVLDQSGAPPERLTHAQFSGGHSVFTEEANRQALAQAVRDFVHPKE